MEMLRVLTPRVEDALNVKSLLRQTCTDTFALPSSTAAKARGFRLTNAFLSGPVTLSGFKSYDGGDITSPVEIDEEYGVVRCGTYTYEPDTRLSITYTSGFAIPSDDEATASNDIHPDALYRVGIGIPDWIVGIVDEMLIQWRRNNLLTPSVTKEYGFLPTLNAHVATTLKGRIYNRYMRPRDNLHWPVKYTAHVV